MASIALRLAVTLFVSACLGAVTAVSEISGDFLDELKIQKLSVCYAYGVDAIGNGGAVTNIVDVARNIFRPCFTPNATFTVQIGGAPDVVVYGTDAYATFVKSVFTAAGYLGTQHLLGSQGVTFVSNKKAKMTTYVIATHKNPDLSISYYNGFYQDDVVKVNGIWKIKRRTLQTLSFVKLTGVPVGI